MRTVDYTRLGLQPGDYVLDLGCGEGRHAITAHMDKDVHVFGIDLNIADLKTAVEKFAPLAPHATAGAGFALSCANALQLPFADDTFDKVICSEVLEHIDDWRGVLAEIERVLKPGGAFCASVPRTWPEQICWAFSREYHSCEGGHLRIFNANELRQDIESCAFPVKLSFLASFREPPAIGCIDHPDLWSRQIPLSLEHLLSFSSLILHLFQGMHQHYLQDETLKVFPPNMVFL